MGRLRGANHLTWGLKQLFSSLWARARTRLERNWKHLQEPDLVLPSDLQGGGGKECAGKVPTLVPQPRQGKSALAPDTTAITTDKAHRTGQPESGTSAQRLRRRPRWVCGGEFCLEPG